MSLLLDFVGGTDVEADVELLFKALPICPFLVLGYRRDSSGIMYIYLVYTSIASAEQVSRVFMLPTSLKDLLLLLQFCRHNLLLHCAEREGM